MFAFKQASQRLVSGLNYNAFPHPLPELRLSSPKLFTIAAHDKSGLLLSLLLFVGLPDYRFASDVIRVH
jgi:hypothetical protein